MNAADVKSPVLILGAGVNGAALARELLLNGVPVCLVDRFDVAYGATSKSSRLIHGGVRYLEYGDFKLVRESLAERTRLLDLAPHLVHPLRLAIPVRTRTRGLLTGAARFLGFGRRLGLGWLQSLLPERTDRGLWTIEIGLGLYDRIAQDGDFPPHSVQPNDGAITPRVNPAEYRWLCKYSDGQMPFPERFVIELLEDARRIAAENRLRFDVHTYCDVAVQGQGVAIRRRTGPPSSESESPTIVEPSAIVNATGAWGDETLRQLGIDGPRLFGGTKGSHFITFHPGLREALGDSGVYAEAADGRMVFVLPFATGALVGTTDERFEQPPEEAIATEREIEYLLELTNELFPDVHLNRSDVALHYCGVRPLPFVPDGKTGAISRDHSIQFHDEALLPTFTLVGGKLTTARAFGEEAAKVVLQNLGVSKDQHTRERPLPGAIDYPQSQDQLNSRRMELAERFGVSAEVVSTLWTLFGTRTEQVLEDCRTELTETIVGTEIPAAVVKWIIRNEWATQLDDLIERRLLLVYRPELSRKTLHSIAGLLPGEAASPTQVDTAVTECAERLHHVYGKNVSE